jgi:hypothetical protein
MRATPATFGLNGLRQQGRAQSLGGRISKSSELRKLQNAAYRAFGGEMRMTITYIR